MLHPRYQSAVRPTRRARSYRSIEGPVLAENADMLKFVKAFGFEARTMPEQPATVRVVKRL